MGRELMQFFTKQIPNGQLIQGFIFADPLKKRDAFLIIERTGKGKSDPDFIVITQRSVSCGIVA
ncbi:hypothetical protein D3C74_289990 [compost metagenome]